MSEDIGHVDRAILGVIVSILIGIAGLMANGVSLIIEGKAMSIAWELSLSFVSVGIVIIVAFVTVMYLIGFAIDKAIALAERWDDG